MTCQPFRDGLFILFWIYIVSFLRVHSQISKEDCGKQTPQGIVDDDHAKCFIYVNSDRKNFADATDACKGRSNGNLVRIKEHKKFIDVLNDGWLTYQIADPDAHYWVGGREQTDKWIWSKTDNKLSFDRWKDSPGDQSCAALDPSDDNKWSKILCSEKHGFVCEGSEEAAVRAVTLGATKKCSGSGDSRVCIMYMKPDKSKLSWFDARDSCLEFDNHKSDLVAIKDSAMKDMVNSLLNESGVNASSSIIWIGATRRVWRFPDGEQMKESFWATGEPHGGNDHTKHCIMMKARPASKYENWYSADCGDTLDYVCEIDIGQSTTDSPAGTSGTPGTGTQTGTWTQTQNALASSTRATATATLHVSSSISFPTLFESTIGGTTANGSNGNQTTGRPNDSLNNNQKVPLHSSGELSSQEIGYIVLGAFLGVVVLVVVISVIVLTIRYSRMKNQKGAGQQPRNQDNDYSRSRANGSRDGDYATRDVEDYHRPTSSRAGRGSSSDIERAYSYPGDYQGKLDNRRVIEPARPDKQDEDYPRTSAAKANQVHGKLGDYNYKKAGAGANGKRGNYDEPFRMSPPDYAVEYTAVDKTKKRQRALERERERQNNLSSHVNAGPRSGGDGGYDGERQSSSAYKDVSGYQQYKDKRYNPRRDKYASPRDNKQVSFSQRVPDVISRNSGPYEYP